MTDGTQWFVQQKLRQFESQCHTAIQRLRTARTLAEAVRFAEVHPDSIISCLCRSEKHGVERALEKTACTLLDQQLAKLGDLPPQEVLAAVGELRYGDWQMLRGHLPALAHKANRAAEKLIQQAQERLANPLGLPPVTGSLPADLKLHEGDLPPSDYQF